MRIRYLASAILFGMMLALSQAAWAEEYYKWTDEDGTVHFTQQPPAEGIEFEVIDIATGRPLQPAQPPAASEDGDESGQDEMPQMASTAVEEPDPEEVAQRCQQARQNVERLTEMPNVYTTGEDGERRRVSDEEREQLIDEARAFMEEWC